MTIREYLEARDISPADFAARIGITPQSLYRYMSGDRMPRRDTLIRIIAESGGDVQPTDVFLAHAVSA